MKTTTTLCVHIQNIIIKKILFSEFYDSLERVENGF